jgi:ribosomal protein S27E
MSIQKPRPDFGEVKCPDCDVIMKPITLPKTAQEGPPTVRECPKCGRRLEKAAQ